MLNLFKLAAFASSITLIAALSASEASEAKRDPEKSRMIVAHAAIQDEFSGLETRPIVQAFTSWMVETSGDILVLPPDETDAMFYEMVMKNDKGEVDVFNANLKEDAEVKDPWAGDCRRTFYVLRLKSKSPIVKTIDGETRQVMAFTFVGCMFKFIVVVSDRMKSENVMYTTMLHELGHMWGLPDNREGKSSVMNGVYPGSFCITKRDIQEVYDAHGKSVYVPTDTGCVPAQ